MTVCIMSNPTNIDMLERLFNSLTIRVYAFVLYEHRMMLADYVVSVLRVFYTWYIQSLYLHAHCVDIYNYFGHYK